LAETRQIAALILLTFLVGISGLTLVSYIPSLTEEDTVVDEYVATFYANGTLVEDYTYLVKASGRYRMLYRVWDAPLSIGELNKPYIQFLRAFSQGQITYVKDFQGSVWVEDRFKNDPQILASVRSLADLNEVGIFNPNRFGAGTYKIRYVFLLHPPLEYDDSWCHLNLQLASSHLKYRNVKVVINDSGYSEAVYLRPPPMRETREGNQIVFLGNAAKDELLEVELVFKKDILTVLNGFSKRVDNVKGLTASANSLYLTQYRIAQILRDGAKALAVLIAPLLGVFYVVVGREKRFVVPRYLSTVPNKERKPWIVNLVFKGDVFDFDENGFYATLLGLHMKRKIRIDEKNGGLLVRVLDEAGGDVYETRAMRFLRSLSKDGVLDSDSVKKSAENLAESGSMLELLQLKGELNYLTSQAEPGIASQFAISGRRRLLPLALLSAFFLAASFLALFTLPSVLSVVSMAVVASIIPVVQSVIAVAFPSTLFGKWLGLAYKEKLEWVSFRGFLSDLALIRKYAPQDLSMWGEWLVYGTALGVGDNVVKAMRDLKIQLPEVNIAPRMPLLFMPVMSTGVPSGRAGGVGGFGGGGGGFGSGGGFGGGGAGRR